MNFLLISQYYPESLLPEFLDSTKCGLDFAAHNLNRAIIDGFVENKAKLNVINVPHLGSFPPFYKKVFVPGFDTPDKRESSISYLNVSYIKRWNIKRKIFNKISDWCSNVKGKKVIIFYSITNLLTMLPLLKNKYPEIITCLLVPDLPEFLAADNTLLTRVNKRISTVFSSKDKSYFECIDSYILLATAMKQKLPVADKPCFLMEGIYCPFDTQFSGHKEKKTILYTGNIGKRYGILNLLEAFNSIGDPDYRLWIRGNGECLNEVLEASRRDSRIIYYEQMSKKDLSDLQKRATVLINPVFSSESFTNYFFPSKTMEYLASATPTIMASLSCIPEEYKNHIFFLDEDSVSGIRNKIIEVCEMDENVLADFGKSASEFIIANKTPLVQISKLIAFFNRCF